MVGEVTQRTYWFKEGRPTEVFDEDIPGLLKYTKMRGCCGEPVRPVSVFKVSDMR